MCLLALFYRVVEDAAVVVGANREEAYRRGGTPPQLHADRVRWVGGVDPAAGGTWLGVNVYGVLAAVTNRRKDRRPVRAAAACSSATCWPAPARPRRENSPSRN